MGKNVRVRYAGTDTYVSRRFRSIKSALCYMDKLERLVGHELDYVIVPTLIHMPRKH